MEKVNDSLKLLIEARAEITRLRRQNERMSDQLKLFNDIMEIFRSARAIQTVPADQQDFLMNQINKCIEFNSHTQGVKHG